MSQNDLLQRMTQSIIDGDVEAAEALARQSLTAGVDRLLAIQQGYKPGLDQIGKGFEQGEYFLPDLVLAGKAMQAAVGILEPKMKDDSAAAGSAGRVLLATVEGDVHTIGKDLVALMLSLSGFEVINLGHDVPTATIVENVRGRKPQLVGLSALLTTTTQAQKDVIEALEDLGVRSQVKVLVGGAATSAEWAAQIGADGYAEDASAAVRKAKQVLGIK